MAVDKASGMAVRMNNGHLGHLAKLKGGGFNKNNLLGLIYLNV